VTNGTIELPVPGIGSIYYWCNFLLIGMHWNSFAEYFHGKSLDPGDFLRGHPVCTSYPHSPLRFSDSKFIGVILSNARREKKVRPKRK
jgi:hypothetical protein